jgi:hypothetical protein
MRACRTSHLAQDYSPSVALVSPLPPHNSMTTYPRASLQIAVNNCFVRGSVVSIRCYSPSFPISFSIPSLVQNFVSLFFRRPFPNPQPPQHKTHRCGTYTSPRRMSTSSCSRIRRAGQQGKKPALVTVSVSPKIFFIFRSV